MNPMVSQFERLTKLVLVKCATFIVIKMFEHFNWVHVHIFVLERVHGRTRVQA